MSTLKRPNDGWAAWVAAEQSLDSVGIDAAAATLPPRLASLLRCVHAALVGDREALQGLLSGAKEHEPLTQVIAAVTRPLHSIDPTRFRAEVKRRGVGNDPFPALDLLRLVVVSLNGQGTSVAPKLKSFAAGRPMLLAALAGLHRAYPAYQLEEELLPRSERFAAVWYAAWIRHRDAPSVREEARRIAPDLPELTQAAWPDLEVRHRSEKRGNRATTPREHGIEAFLAGPETANWTHLCGLEVRKASADDELATALLRRLLPATHVALAAGRLAAMLPAIRACRGLGVGLPRAARETLTDQLNTLEQRVGLLCSVAEPADFAAAWRSARDLALDERRAIARLLTERSREPWPGHADALGLAIQAGLLANESPALFAEHVADLPVHQQRRAIEGLQEPRRTIVEGYAQLIRGNDVACLKLATKALRAGADSTLPLDLFASGLRQCAEAGPRSRSAVREASAEFLDRAQELGLRLSSESLAILSVFARTQPLTFDPRLSSALRPHLPRDWSDATVGCGEFVLPLLTTIAAVDSLEAAQQSFRAFGRWLRGADERRAVSGSLAVACALQFTAHGSNSGPLAAPDPALANGPTSWLAAMNAFLDRYSDATVAGAAFDLVVEDDLPSELVAGWLQTRPKFGKAQLWKRALAADDFVSDFQIRDPFQDLSP